MDGEVQNWRGEGHSSAADEEIHSLPAHRGGLCRATD